jgi:hypothetical protein
MAAAFITCSPPRAMATEAATAWLERRAELLRDAQAVEEVTLRELRPRHQDIVWLLHVRMGSHASRDWNRLLGELVRDLRRLGMQPTVCIDERPREPGTAQPELAPVA